MNKTQLKWDEYAPVFSQITTRFQIEMYEESAKWLSGDIIDCGCGSGKLAPYLPRQVTGYLGVDSSPMMINLAEQTLKTIARADFAANCQSIEDVTGLYDSAVSLQSYYSWVDPQKILIRIHDLITVSGVLVLASANSALDIEMLLDKASKEWILFPDWENYARYNRQLAAKPEGNFATLDTLVSQLRDAGFKILDAHTHLFQGGVNFVVVRK